MHIQPRALQQYPWWLRLVYRRQLRRYGQPLTPALIWGRRPRLFVAFARLFAALDGRSSLLPATLRSLVMIRVSQLNDCAFCVDLNARLLAERSGEEAQLQALPEWRTSQAFDERTRAALAYAEAMTGPGCRVAPGLIAELRRFFDDDAIVELTALIGFQNMSSRFNSALDLPSQGLCRTGQPD